MIDQLKTSNIREAFQRFVKDFVKPLETNSRLDGRRITGINLVAATPQDIIHKLGREPVGWEITNIVWVGAVDATVRCTGWDDKIITLDAPVTGMTLDIWIY